jgi:hypothetical protein
MLTRCQIIRVLIAVIPVIPYSFAAHIIRKRIVKLTVQFEMEELLPVSYVNGVLFCKIIFLTALRTLL